MQSTNVMQCPSRDSNARPSDYRAGALSTEPSHHTLPCSCLRAYCTKSEEPINMTFAYIESARNEVILEVKFVLPMVCISQHKARQYGQFVPHDPNFPRPRTSRTCMKSKCLTSLVVHFACMECSKTIKFQILLGMSLYQPFSNPLFIKQSGTQKSGKEQHLEKMVVDLNTSEHVY